MKLNTDVQMQDLHLRAQESSIRWGRTGGKAQTESSNPSGTKSLRTGKQKSTHNPETGENGRRLNRAMGQNGRQACVGLEEQGQVIEMEGKLDRDSRWGGAGVQVSQVQGSRERAYLAAGERNMSKYTEND